MTSHKFAWLSAGLLTSAGVTALTSMMTAALAFGDDPALILGPSGVSLPGPDYVSDVQSVYLDHLGFGGYRPQALYLPNNLYPLTGVNTLPLDISAAQGKYLLNAAIQPHIDQDNPVVVFGYSQSSLVASEEMDALKAIDPAGSDPIKFILTGDPANPNGGLVERFDGLAMPSLGATFTSGATPDTPYDTVIYTGEYDGFADFPQYPINLLSDINAVLGILYVHSQYAPIGFGPGYTAGQIAGATHLTNVVEPTDTTYYIVPTQTLPLLEPLVQLGVPAPFIDLIQPDLRVLVNLGYGDPDYGYSTGPANVPTPFGLFPPLSDLEKVPGDLLAGTTQGISKAWSDLMSLPSTLPATLSTLVEDVTSPQHLLSVLLDTPSSALPAMSPEALLAALASLTSPTAIVNDLTFTAANLVRIPLVTADVALAAAISAPLYGVESGLAQLDSGNLVGAVGDPIAANVGIDTILALFELRAIQLGVQDELVTALAPLGNDGDLAGLSDLASLSDISALIP